MKKVEILFTIMKDGKPVPVEKMLKTLNVKQGSIMCLISALRNDFGANIETVRDGRKVLTYQLTNVDKVKISTKAPKVAKAPKAPKVAVLRTKTTIRKPKAAVVDDGSVATVEVVEVGFDELAALRAELGLGDSYAE